MTARPGRWFPQRGPSPLRLAGRPPDRAFEGSDSFARRMILLSSLSFWLTAVFGLASYLVLRPLHPGQLGWEAPAVFWASMAIGTFLYAGPYLRGLRVDFWLFGVAGVVLITLATILSIPWGGYFSLLFLQVLIFSFYSASRTIALYVASLVLAALPLAVHFSRDYLGLYLLLVPVFTLTTLYTWALAGEFRRQRAERRVLEAMMDAGTLSTTSALPETLAGLARGLVKVSQAALARVYIFDAGEPVLMREASGVAADGSGVELPPLALERAEGVARLAVAAVEETGSREAIIQEATDGLPGALGMAIVADDRVLGAFVLVAGRASAAVFRTLAGRPLPVRVPREALAILANEAAVLIRNSQLYEDTRRLALTDPLTGLYNARALERRLSEEVARSRREGLPIGMLVADLDGFKAVNDLHGHKRGDEVLVMMSNAILANIRAADLAFRYGGDEFVVLLPDTGRAEAEAVADRIARAVAALPLPGLPGHLKLSVGIAVFPDDADDEDSLFNAADRAMYVRKPPRQAPMTWYPPST